MTAARAAVDQDWSPFVLVAGLLLIGLAAERDGVFAAAGRWLAGLSSSMAVLYCGAVVLVSVVTAVLNLDTSVTFVTPVLVHAARRRGRGEAPLLYACILLSNAASLLLPGSNLTNLIVLGELHLSGTAFVARSGLAWALAVVVTAGVVAVAERSEVFGGRGGVAEGAASGGASATGEAGGRGDAGSDPPVIGVGLAAVAAAVALMLVLRSAAVPVAAVGLVATVVRLRSRAELSQARRVLGVPLLVGLFAVAVGLGTLGRQWSGPEQLLGHLDSWATAAFAAVVVVLVNNLPAASLLAAHPPPHPYALLVGLDVGPNLFVTGSLSWILWLRTSRAAGSTVSLWRGVAIGAISAPLAMAAALGGLAVARAL